MSKYLLTIFFLFSEFVSFSQEKEESSIDELNQQLENPLSRFWSLIVQENLSFNNGDFIDGTQVTNVLNFQPSLPVPVGKAKMLLVRPVFPIVTAPNLNSDGTQDGYETGFGDMQVFSLFGPDKKGGVVWGAGMTFVFPTASSTNLGSGKTQLGPAVMVLSMTPNWTTGGIIQHWNSVGGDENRHETSKTDIQYIIRKQIKGKGMSIGMGPNISIDWEASEGNRVNFPIGLGITKTVKWGDFPWKLRLEPQYAIIKQQDYGSLWNIRIQIAPIIKNPFL